MLTGSIPSPIKLLVRYCRFIDLHAITKLFLVKKVSCGAIVLYCLNLPPHLWYLPENILIIGLMPPNITFSWVTSTHIIWKSNQYSIFMCIASAYFSGGKTILPRIFQHQLPPKDFIFPWIQCICSLSHKLYSPQYFSARSHQNITLSCVLSAHIIPQAKQYSPQYFSPICWVK